MVPDVEGGATLTILLADAVLWTRHAPPYSPRIHSVRCDMDAQTARLTWTDAVASDEHYKATPQWWTPDHPHWQRLESSGPIVPSLPGFVRSLSAGFTFDLFELPVGEVFLRVQVSDGFHTTTSESVTVVVPHRPIRIEIYPPMGMIAGRTMVHAIARAYQGEHISDDEAYHWLIDGEEQGRGASLSLDPPAAGRHEATVIVRWKGEEAQQSIEFWWPWRGNG